MDSLYVLTGLPAAIVRKIWYYMGAGTRASFTIKKQIGYWSRKTRDNRWMETQTLWNIGRHFVGGMFDAKNPLRLPLLLWCEYRVIVSIVVEQNGMHLTNLKALYEMWDRVFKTNQHTIFNGTFNNKLCRNPIC